MQETIQLYLFISFLALFAIVLLLFLIKNNKKIRNVTSLEGLSLIFVVIGIFYGVTTAFGYALICAGVVFFVGDFYLRMRKVDKPDKKVVKKKK
ncbi:hypothetical protein GW931_02850 [archaeon]|nr:hypothetical protein [archaeon]